MADALRSQVSKFVESNGLSKAAKTLGMSDSAVSRYLAGLPVRNGTLALLEAKAKSGELKVDGVSRKKTVAAKPRRAAAKRAPKKKRAARKVKAAPAAAAAAE